MNRIGKSAEGIIAYHSTDKTGFAAFDVAAAGPYNVGFHFGTRAAAEAPDSHRLNADIIGIFKSLGYDGLVYLNELEDGASAADSYVVFDARQITVLGEEKVAKAKAA